MARWTLLYDTDCGVCTWIMAGVLALDRQDRIAPRAIQSERGADLLSDLDPEERLASVHLVSPGGDRHSAGAALAPLLKLLPGGGLPARALSRVPRLTARSYDWVADHRTGLSRAVPAAAKRRARARVQRAEAERG